jgi:ankyrin repeat protein
MTAAIFLSGCRKSIHDAVEYNDLETVKRLIGKGADVNAPDEDGMTPLHIAAVVGRKDVAELLIENGADIHARRAMSGWTPLHTAGSSRTGAPVAELLVLRGADIGALAHSGATPLHSAAIGGNVPVVRLLAAKGADLNARDQRGNTPLYWAVEYQGYRYKEIVDTFLGLGAKVLGNTGSSPLEVAVRRNDMRTAHVLAGAVDKGWRSDHGDAPLHWAVRSRHLKLVRVLVEHGAELNARDGQGYTPLDVAVKYAKEKDIIEFLKSKGAEGTLREKAPTRADISEEELLAKVRGILSEGGNVNVQDHAGRTALHTGCQYGYRDAVDFLLAKGASPNIGNEIGFTALHYAVMFGQLEIAKTLIDHGANVNAKDSDQGCTPIYFVLMAKHNEIELLTLLLDNGADWRVSPEFEGLTPLHMAVGQRDPVALRLLLARGADPKVKDKTGETHLHRAARVGYDDMVKLLIEVGAEVNATDSRGMTPLDWAVAGGEKAAAAAEVLRQHGGKTTEAGKTLQVVE